MNKQQHAANIAAIDCLQMQDKPMLTERTYKNAAKHEIMLQNAGNISGSHAQFVCVKGADSWAMYFTFGYRSPEWVAANGLKATIAQVNQVIHVEGDLIELYRR